MNIGKIIRNERIEKGLTLQELARKSGVALATLSRIENGKMTGTLKSHMDICEALGTTLPGLYDKLYPPKKSDLHGGKVELVSRDKVSLETLVSNVRDKKMMPVLVKIAARGRTQTRRNSHGTETFVYLLDGALEAHIGSEKYNLKKGDSLYFDSSLPHHFKNSATSETRFLIMTSPPGA